MKERKNDFSKGSIARSILSLAVPMTVAQLTVVLYNVVDRMFIGHIPDVGRDALTGIGLVMPVVYIITAFSNLSGMGALPFSPSPGAMGMTRRPSGSWATPSCICWYWERR